MVDPFDPELQCLYKPLDVIHVPFDAGSLVGDLHPPLPDNVDLAVISKPLDYLYNPYLAAARLRDALKPGGLVFLSVPLRATSNPSTAFDQREAHSFSHITGVGVIAMLLSVGLEVIEAGHWGNRAYWTKYMEHLHVEGTDEPERPTLSQVQNFTNDLDLPARINVLAKRPKHLYLGHPGTDITLCVPCAPHHQQYLERLLDDVKCQSVQPSEILVVLTGASAVDLLPLKAKLQSKVDPDLPIYLVTLEGPTSQPAGQLKNKCIDLAHGDILSFFDADDRMHPQPLEAVSRSVGMGVSVVVHPYLFPGHRRPPLQATEKALIASILNGAELYHYAERASRSMHGIVDFMPR